MTTQVRIEIIQEHMPVVVERSDGLNPRVIKNAGEAVFDYVHAGQSLSVREITATENDNLTKEVNASKLQRLLDGEVATLLDASEVAAIKHAIKVLKP